METLSLKFIMTTFSLILVGFSLSAQRWEDVSESHLPAIVHKPYNSMDTKVVDIDGDGDLDMVIAVEFVKNVILLNDGTGRFEDGSNLLPNKRGFKDPKPYRYYPYHDSEDVAVADFDKDGLIEIIIVTEDDETNEYYEMNASGSFDDISDQLPGKGVSNGLIAHDFDNDGWIDIVVANNGQNYYWKNDKGTLIDASNQLPQIEDITQDVEAGDYDNDGDLDIIVGNEKQNRLLRNDGSGNFEDVTRLTLQGGIGEETREADFGDVDGDGDLDIYFANVQLFQKVKPVPRLLINHNGVYKLSNPFQIGFPFPTGSMDADLVDIDNDGDLDLLMGNGNLQGAGTKFTAALNDGKGNFSEFKIPIDESGILLIVDIEAADFNNDGKMDIYLSCFRAGDRLLLGK